MVFTQDGVPATEIAVGLDLIANGIADTFEAAKAAALLQSKGAVLKMGCTVSGRTE